MTTRSVRPEAHPSPDAARLVLPRLAVDPAADPPFSPSRPADLATAPTIAATGSTGHLPAIDVAAAGGWGDTQALTRIYQKATAAGVLAAVNGG